MKIRAKLAVYVLLSISLLLPAQEDEKTSGAAQANNPLANMTALNFHNYYMPRLTDAPDDAYMNTGWIRFAKPFVNGKFLFRLSAPLATIATPGASAGTVDAVNGLGDINAFLSYSFISKSTATVGIGPLLAAPTATETALGAEKWQGGLAFVAFFARSPVFQYGGLITWQASFAGNEERSETNLMAIQPFYFWQLGKGTYLRGAPVWVFNLEEENYAIPMGIGIGKVVPVDNIMFNLFIEPQYTLLHKGTQPQFQLFTGINIQIMGD